MNSLPHRRLSAHEIEQLSSPYLSEGRKQDTWQIVDVQIEDKHLSAKVCMRTTYVSSTDAKGFHLSINSAMEFVPQLAIIYFHVWAGLSKKTREVWMVEFNTRSVRSIRNSQAIQVDMTVQTMRRRGEQFYCVADFRVTDDQDGLFEIRVKGFVPQGETR